MSARAGIYQPLNVERREIRLIRMLYDNTETVHCELQAFSLDDEPKYTALSYVWTEKPASRQILINGQAFLVRPNLHDYLLQMRSEKRENWLFVDAICTDQDDDDERSAQVALMGSVYGAAAEVVAWMGTDHREPDFDERIMQKMENLFVTGILDLQALQEDKRLAHCVLDSFFGPVYWSRLWVVQEILLAQELWLQFRGLRLSAEEAFAWVSSFFASSGLFPDESFATSLRIMIQRENNHMAYANLALWCLRLRKNSIDERSHLKLSIDQVVSMVAYQECSRKHDRVFGILGVTNINIRPDYSMSMTELYVRIMAEWEIEHAYETEHDGRWREKVDFSLGLASALGLTLRHPVTALLTTEGSTQIRQQILLRKPNTSVCLGKEHDSVYTALLHLDNMISHESNLLLVTRFQEVFVLLKLWTAKISRAKIKDPAGSEEKKTLREWITTIEDIWEDVWLTAAARAGEKPNEVQAPGLTTGEQDITRTHRSAWRIPLLRTKDTRWARPRTKFRIRTFIP